MLLHVSFSTNKWAGACLTLRALTQVDFSEPEQHYEAYSWRPDGKPLAVSAAKTSSSAGYSPLLLLKLVSDVPLSSKRSPRLSSLSSFSYNFLAFMGHRNH
ncbi:hypothetical protein CHARACLAT_008918 [Characodon lateralis]|uniref:Uncharacterized protein n=1 Tax=Characodon lateralis TaxID=208331 RepID=A0ABU7CW32_9TELE|nr:hypothetical protein [Characodon lateralis]